MNESEKIILEQTRKLEKLEKEYLKYSYECKKPANKDEVEEYLSKTITIAQEAFIIKNEIQIEFSKITDLTIFDPIVLRTIDKIKNNEMFYSILFYENIAEMLNKNIKNWNDKLDVSIHDYLLSEKSDELFDEFHTWFDVCYYYSNKMRVGAIISSSHIPKKVLPYFEEIRETYAFGQLRSSIALCRALLEMILFDKLNRLKAFATRPQQPTNINPEKEGNLNIYIRLAKIRKIINNNETDIAHSIRIYCNSILHLKDEDITPNKSDTFGTIVDTIGLIESIYRR
jgi:hypothetical protein